jgi:hypothetical protein
VACRKDGDKPVHRLKTPGEGNRTVERGWTISYDRSLLTPAGIISWQMKSNTKESKFFMKLHYFYCCTIAAVPGVYTVPAAGCSSTGTGFNARIISLIATKQQASSSEEYGSHQPARSPACSDLFGFCTCSKGVLQKWWSRIIRIFIKMYPLGSLIVELQTARGRLLNAFEVPDGMRESGRETHEMSKGPESIGGVTRIKTSMDVLRLTTTVIAPKDRDGTVGARPLS